MDEVETSGTFRLFARPGFISGIARLVDFGNGLNIYNWERTPEEADLRALETDWKMVGGDMARAIRNEPEQAKK